MTDVLAVLRAERDRLDRAIAVMETEPKRRGRKPGSAAVAAAAAGEAPKKRGRKKMSPAARKAVSERMRKYWAERRKNG
jgi:hypothetical protein